MFILFYFFKDKRLNFFFFLELGYLCIVMDFCEGGDLYNKIRSMRGSPISEDQVCSSL